MTFTGPVWAGLTVDFQYDALGVVPDGSSSARGRRIAEKHFGTSGLFSWTCIVKAPGLAADARAAAARAGEAAELCARIPAVVDVWSLAHPRGMSSGEGVAETVAAALGRPFYLSEEPECLRLTGLARSTRFQLERDGKFPRRRQISAGRVGWLASELTEWMRTRREAPPQRQERRGK